MDLLKIIQTARKIGCSYFVDFAHQTNTDKGKEMIVFVNKWIHSRKVNDWGRDEDTHDYIGLDKEGWIIYRQKVEVGAGPFKITEEGNRKIEDEEMVQLFKENLSLSYIEECLQIRNKYPRDFNNSL